MKSVITIITALFLFAGCNEGSGSAQQPEASVRTNVPQPDIGDSELKPPVPPSF